MLVWLVPVDAPRDRSGAVPGSSEHQRRMPWDGERHMPRNAHSPALGRQSWNLPSMRGYAHPGPDRDIMCALSGSSGGSEVAAHHGARVTTVTLSSPNPPALARFYQRLLGWEIGTEDPGWVTLRNPAGG